MIVNSKQNIGDFFWFIHISSPLSLLSIKMDQEKALDILKAGRNVFLTGSAGTGKTHLLNNYITYLKRHKINVAITASTGIAATHMGGQTIHAWSGIGVKDDMNDTDLRNLKTKAYLLKKIDKAKVLIIDEISMLHRRQLDLINKVLKFLKKTDDAFGGLQVVLSGDFFQLPPVSQNEASKEKFCFMSDAWLDADFSICYLTKQYRQKNNSLHTILDQIRAQDVSDESRQLLWDSKNNKLTGEITKLYTHNVDVDRINQDHFDSIEGTARAFTAKMKGKKQLKEILAKSILADEIIKLKKGTKVMFVKNNFERGYVNGTLGEVIDFWNNEGTMLPIVQTKANKKIYAEPEVWAMEDEKGTEIASFNQIPLRLAWAITVHKSQGMTLDAAEVDLTHTFETGQGYVALSRLSDLEGLKLLGFNSTTMKVDPLAFKADKRFKELSHEGEIIFVEKELEAMRIQFILDTDGVLKAINLKKEKEKEPKQSKLSTYDKTYEMFMNGSTWEEIVKERDLTAQTILRHFLVIKKDHPETNFSRFNPDKKDIDKVQKAISKIDKEELIGSNGHVKLAPLYKELKGAMDYKTIELALLFCEY